MKENSIEEDIKIIKRLITTKFNNDYSIDNKDKEAIEHILSDYKRVLKENEELKFEERSRIIGKYGEVEIHDVINRTLSNDYISIKKVKDKISERQFELQQEYKDFEDDAILTVLQELIEGR